MYESGYNIVACFTNPDKPSGRGMKIKYSAVKEYALEKNIPIYQPKKLRNNEEIIQKLKELINIPSVYEKSDDQNMPFGKNANSALEYILNLGDSLG